MDCMRVSIVFELASLYMVVNIAVNTRLQMSTKGSSPVIAVTELFTFEHDCRSEKD